MLSLYGQLGKGSRSSVRDLSGSKVHCIRQTASRDIKFGCLILRKIICYTVGLCVYVLEMHSVGKQPDMLRRGVFS